MGTVIDDYISDFEGSAHDKLVAMRDLIRGIAPEASEKIGYGIPTWVLNGNLVHIAGFARHVSLFPGAEPVEVFASELSGYKTSKGTIQFPLDADLPMELIGRIVEFRAAQQRAKLPGRRPKK